MATDKKALEGIIIYDFDSGYTISYINYNRPCQLVGGRLIVAFAKDPERITLAFEQPSFNDPSQNILSAKGVKIVAEKNTNEIWVLDAEDSTVFFKAFKVRDITPR